MIRLSMRPGGTSHGRCLQQDTIANSTGCEPVSNLDGRMIGPAIRDLAEELILVSFRIDLCIYILSDDICKVVFG